MLFHFFLCYYLGHVLALAVNNTGKATRLLFVVWGPDGDLEVKTCFLFLMFLPFYKESAAIIQTSVIIGVRALPPCFLSIVFLCFPRWTNTCALCYIEQQVISFPGAFVRDYDQHSVYISVYVSLSTSGNVWGYQIGYEHSDVFCLFF